MIILLRERKTVVVYLWGLKNFCIKRGKKSEILDIMMGLDYKSLCRFINLSI